MSRFFFLSGDFVSFLTLFSLSTAFPVSDFVMNGIACPTSSWARISAGLSFNALPLTSFRFVFSLPDMITSASFLPEGYVACWVTPPPASLSTSFVVPPLL